MKKRLLCFILSSVMLIGISSVFASEEARESTIGAVSYDGMLFNESTGSIVRGKSGDVKIPEKINGVTVTRIGNGAFAEIYGLKSIDIPKTVTDIGENAFSACNLKTVTGGENVTFVGGQAFFDTPWCNDKEGHIIIGKTYIGYNGDDTTVIIPEGVESFSERMEGDFPQTVKKVILPSTIKEVSDNAFRNCKALGEVVSGDLNISSWAETEVMNAQNEGLVPEGLGSDYTRNITREEFASLAVALYEKKCGEITPVKVGFADTNSINVAKAYTIGVVNGVSEDKFAPDKNITRQEMCVMTVRNIEAMLKDDFLLTYNDHIFEDDTEIDDWAFEQVLYAYDNSIIKGVGDNKISPLGTATIEQSIILNYRVCMNMDSFKAKDGINKMSIQNEEIVKTIDDINKVYADAKGYIDTDKHKEAAYEVSLIAKELLAQGKIRSYKYSEEANHVEMIFLNGLDYIYQPMDGQTFGGFGVSGIESFNRMDSNMANVSTLSTFRSRTDDISKKIDACKSYTILTSSNATIPHIYRMLRNCSANNTEVFVWSSHSVVTEKGVFLGFMTGDKYSATKYEGYAKLLKYSTEKGVASNEYVGLCNGYFYVKEPFVNRYMTKVERGVFFSTACDSLTDNAKMCKTILNKGFNSFIGTVTGILIVYAEDIMEKFINHMCDYEEGKDYTITVSEAFKRATENNETDMWGNSFIHITGGGLSGTDPNYKYRLIPEKSLKGTDKEGVIYLTVRAEYEDGTAATGNATLICHGAGRKQGINSEAIGYWFKENGEVTYSVTYVADIDYNNSYLQTDNGRIALCEGEIIYSDVTETGGTVEIEIILPNEMKN